MNRDAFSNQIVTAGLSELEAGIRILWFLQRVGNRSDVHANEVLDFFVAESISDPNRSRLQKRLQADSRVLRGVAAGQLKLRAKTHREIDEEFKFDHEAIQPTSKWIALLESHVENLNAPQTREFVIEAIKCARSNALRAAIIMSWCGAISVLQDYIFSNHLAAFNIDAMKNGLLKKPAQSLADMRDISKESHFIESLSRISVIDDATKRMLKRCLDRRNEAGHPSEVIFSDTSVADHIDSLALNVFVKYGSN